MRSFTRQKGIPSSARAWHLVDADGKVVGRLASRLARVLMGKHRPTYAPQVDNGDFVVVTNAARLRFTGSKWAQKKYYRNTGYPSGLRVATAREWAEQHPERILEKAVRRMLPKTSLGERMFSKLKVYPGVEHPHGAQNPAPLQVS